MEATKGIVAIPALAEIFLTKCLSANLDGSFKENSRRPRGSIPRGDDLQIAMVSKPLCGQVLAAGFGAERNKNQPDSEGDGRHRDWSSERSKMPDAVSDQKSDSSPAESRE